MANVSSSNGLEKYPKLRFPEFDEPWNESKLSACFAKNIKKNTDGRISNVICNSAKMGLIPQRDYFDKDIANSDNTSGYYIIEHNDFVYNPRKSSDAPYGPISRYAYSDAGIVSPLYLCFRAKGDVDTNFFEWYFRSSAWHRYIYMTGDSGARHDRVSIKDDDFFSMPIRFPSSIEQKKITSFLNAIERRISSQQLLVDNLKKYKRGVIQRAFSERKANDKTNFPKWKISSFGEFFTEQTIWTSNSPDTPLVSLTVEDGITPKTDRYYREFLITKEGNNYKEIKPGWFAYNPMNAHLGAIAPNHLGYTAAVSGYYNIFSVNEVDTISFWEEYLTSYPMLIHYKLIATGSLIEKQRVHYSQFVNIQRCLPSVEEQKHLSKLFETVNKKIANSETMMRQLCRMRASLLQHLFI
jgi:type I restriction enzyme S subunit